MNKELLKLIKELSLKDKKSLSQKALKTSEETGELARVILPFDNAPLGIIISLLERPVNLADLFHPETFLNALRQRSARKLQQAIDELKLVSSFEANKIPRDNCIQIEGLWLQGCEFDGKRMNDAQD